MYGKYTYLVSSISAAVSESFSLIFPPIPKTHRYASLRDQATHEIVRNILFLLYIVCEETILSDIKMFFISPEKPLSDSPNK